MEADEICYKLSLKSRHSFVDIIERDEFADSCIVSDGHFF